MTQGSGDLLRSGLTGGVLVVSPRPLWFGSRPSGEPNYRSSMTGENTTGFAAGAFLDYQSEKITGGSGRRSTEKEKMSGRA